MVTESDDSSGFPFELRPPRNTPRLILVMQLDIRPYRPSDKEPVLTIFSIGIQEHIGPCFYNAMTSPAYLTITLALCSVGYLLGSVLACVVLPGVWVGLVYYCCHELYAGFVRERLQTDMQDIPGSFLSRPDDSFWVAEAQVDGRTQIMGMVAVVSKQSGEEKYGELFRMIISPLCRRAGLGIKMAQTVIDFCEQRGFSKVVLETSSTQTAAVALYKKLGFSHVSSHYKTEVPFWILNLVMQLHIRPYRPSDKEPVLTIFSIGIQEHIGPCFYNAMTSPAYLTITLALCSVGYLLGSVLACVVLPGVWVGLVYYCCHELYAGVVRERLQTDMQNIPGIYMSRPDDCFWVAEAQVDGRTQIMGIVAVVGKQSGEEKYGELFRMIISPLCRRAGLGIKMAQTVIDFCEQRGFSKVVLGTTTTQTAAVALYKKLGFSHVNSQFEIEVPFWILRLAKVKFLTMEKHLHL